MHLHGIAYVFVEGSYVAMRVYTERVSQKYLKIEYSVRARMSGGEVLHFVCFEGPYAM